MRNATRWRTFCLLQDIFAFGEVLSTSSCPFVARFTLKTALNSHDECNEFADPAFVQDHHYKSFCLSRDSLSCATPSFDLCIILKFIFLYLWYTFRTILALFTHFVYTNFFICILPCQIFFLSLMMPLIGESWEFNINF